MYFVYLIRFRFWSCILAEWCKEEGLGGQHRTTQRSYLQ